MKISIIEKIISHIKKDPDYIFEHSLTKIEIFTTIIYRTMQIIRGFIKFKLFISAKGIVFCGKNVELLHKSLISRQGTLIIESNVFIDAFSFKGIYFGENATIKRNASIICSGVLRYKGIGLSVGSNSAIGSYNFINANGGVTIGNDVIIGPYVFIFSANHNFLSTGRLIRLQGESYNEVIIGNNCWIGAGSIILPGVNIGENCIIGAGSVVTKNIPANSVAFGNPAKIRQK